MTFEELESVGNGRNERNDCSVIAVALTCNVPYEYAHEALREAGRRDRGTVPNWVILQAINSIGGTIGKSYIFELEKNSDGRKTGEVVNPDGQVVRYIVNHAVTCRTIEKYADPDKRYLVFVRGHVLAVVDGKVQDWTEGRRFVVRSMMEVKGA